MAPNVSGIETPSRRMVYGMCGMCAVRCPMEVTVGDGRVTWLQANTHDQALGASLCAKGAAGLFLESDDERPQTPLIRAGERGVASALPRPRDRLSVIPAIAHPGQRKTLFGEES